MPRDPPHRPTCACAAPPLRRAAHARRRRRWAEEGDAASARRQDGGALCLDGVTVSAAGGDVRPPPGPAWQVAAGGTEEGCGEPGEGAGGPEAGLGGTRGLGGEGGCGPARCLGGPPQKGAGFGATPVCDPWFYFERRLRGGPPIPLVPRGGLGSSSPPDLPPHPVRPPPQAAVGPSAEAQGGCGEGNGGLLVFAGVLASPPSPGCPRVTLSSHGVIWGEVGNEALSPLCMGAAAVPSGHGQASAGDTALTANAV